MLDLEAVTAAYGAVVVLAEVSMAVHEGEIVALLGGNGAGKTTALRVISGLLRPRSGTVRFRGARIDGLPPDRIVASGIGHVPEGRLVFPDLTVGENLRMGAYTRRDRGGVRDDLDRVLTHFPILRDRFAQPARTLSGGEQQMLVIARALMARPALLLLDEPSLGLAPRIVRQIFDIVHSINAAGTTVLMVEQNAYLALGLASRAYVLQKGRIRLSGPVADLRRNPEVERLYLGR
ncbi:MAG: ABC transporter ATP-binding protein [Armatimonadota bacterium]|nr:ABC transporter ATP-binding protein [Armatimonadota bacterium]MDR7474500.1 ABC transporter ATP-binding protein [Armatimonadota bacterium]MDR7539823.1 ABC transporter ATP-binding protein [Armatimonadota bacterium]